jgi:uncharacterized protein
MDAVNPPLAAETEALRNDIAATVEALDPQIERTKPAEFPGGGTYHGHEGVKAYLSQSRAAWAEIHSEPERLIVAGDKIVFVQVRAKPKHGTERHEARIADVFTFRNGKAIQMRAWPVAQEIAERDRCCDFVRSA